MDFDDSARLLLWDLNGSDADRDFHGHTPLVIRFLMLSCFLWRILCHSVNISVGFWMQHGGNGDRTTVLFL